MPRIAKKGRPKAKCHEYKEMKLKSGLELFAAQQLDQAGILYHYEKRSFILIEKFTSTIESLEENKKQLKVATKKSQAISYTPDFICDDNSPYQWIIETKGAVTPVFLMRWKLFKRYLTLNNIQYDLFRPRTKEQVMECIKVIKTKLKQ